MLDVKIIQIFALKRICKIKQFTDIVVISLNTGVYLLS